MSKSLLNNAKPVLASATNVIYSLSIATLFWINILDAYDELDLLNKERQYHPDNMSKNQLTLFIFTIFLTTFFTLALIKTFHRLMQKVFNLSQNEHEFWETRMGRNTEGTLAGIAAVYRSGVFSFLSGLLVYQTTESKIPAGTLGSIMFLGSSVAQYGLFVHSNNKKLNSKDELQPLLSANTEITNPKRKRIISYVTASLHSLNNTIMYTNSCRIFCNNYLKQSISMDLKKNSISETLIISGLTTFIGIPFFHVMFKTYFTVVTQLFSLEVNHEENRPLLKKLLKYEKYYTAFLKAFLSAASVNQIISSLASDEPSVNSHIYIAGIPTLIAFAANFMGRFALYFKIKHDNNNTSLQATDKISSTSIQP